MNTYPSYSVCIRTLGKAGDLYRREILSLKNQAHQPDGIFVYVAEGYDFPERVADEVYTHCPKGMVSQRSLTFEEVKSDYILFCDDDFFFPPDAATRLFDALLENKADCISPNVYPNHQWSFKEKCIAALFYGTYPSLFSKYAFRIRKSSFYSYALFPRQVMPTQSFSGGCFLIDKQVFSRIHFEEERWIEASPYANGEDQLIAYKLFVNGYKSLVYFDTGILHLDARSSHTPDARKNYYYIGLVRYVLWYRTIYQPCATKLGKAYASLCYYAQWCWLFILALCSRALGKSTFKVRTTIEFLKDAKRFVRSESFTRIPVWTKKI